MTIKDVQELYLSNGFIWNDEIASFIVAYGGKKLDYIDSFSGGLVPAEFFPLDDVRSGRKYGTYTRTAEHLGAEIVPVGYCCNGDIELLLTEAGDIIGFADHLLLSWSTAPSPNWEDAMSNLLHGKKPRQIGHALGNENLDPQS